MKIETKKIISGIAAVLFITWIFASSSVTAQTNTKKSKKTTTTQYLHLKVEKDENGNVTKIDTIVSCDEGTNEDIMIKDIDLDIDMHDFEKEIESMVKNGLKNMPACFSMSVSDGDSAVDIDIMKKIKIECNGKNGKEKVRIFCTDEEESDGGLAESIMDKIKNGSTKSSTKAFVISIDDNGIDISGNSNGKKIKKNIKIQKGNISLKDASGEEKKIIESETGKTSSELNIDNLSISPNPGNGKFHIEFELAEKGTTEIKITDLTGKEIYSKKIKNFKGSFSENIDISKSEKGIYLLYIKQDNKSKCKKIIVQ